MTLLTKAQRRVVETRDRLIRERGGVPSNRAIAIELGLSTQAVTWHLRQLGIASATAAKRERGELVEQVLARRRAERVAERARLVSTAAALAKAGLTQAEIGKHIGRTPAWVSMQLRAAGCGTYDRWTADDFVRMVELLAGGMCLRKVARELRRSTGAVSTAWYRLQAGETEATKAALARLTADQLEDASLTFSRTRAGAGIREPGQGVPKP